MLFRVGPWQYTVEITNGQLCDDGGNPCAGLCIWSDGRILLSGTLPPRKRVDSLLHELRHCWRHHLGAPSDPEDDCNNAASFALDVMRQLARQGGEQALMRLTAEGVIDHTAGPTDLPGAIVGAECTSCSGRFSAAQVVTGPARHSPILGVPIVTRSVFCDFCGHVQVWQEGATLAGHPNGQLLGEVRHARGEAVTAFLREYGQKMHLFT